MIPLLSQAAMRGPPAGAGGDDVREVHVARFHVVEFQKRGLPHAHLLLWLDDAREARDEVRAAPTLLPGTYLATHPRRILVEHST